MIVGKAMLTTMWHTSWILLAVAALCCCGGSQASTGSSGASGRCTPVFGRLQVRGVIDSARAHRAFQARAEQIGRCLSHEPEEVSLTLRVVVPADGRPSQVLVADGTLREQRTGDCLERQVRRLRFPST